VRELVGKILECEPRDWPADSAIDDVRAKLWGELSEANPLHTARLQFLFSQDLLAQTIFSEHGLCLEAAQASAEWTRRQLRARAVTWPLDQSGDRNERIHLALVQAFRKKPVLSLKDIKDAINYYRPGSGGPGALNATLRQMGFAQEIVPAGHNRSGSPIFRWVGDEGVVER
jgi:hypothetical protein